MFGRNRNRRRRAIGHSKLKRLQFESLETRVALSASNWATLASPLELGAAAEPIAAEVVDSLVPSLQFQRFNELTAAQAPLLTVQQIASIPDPYWFGEIPAAVRAAFSQSQVQALKVDKVRIALLTTRQLAWLTPAQIRSLDVFDFPHLLPNQIPTLTAAQVSTIPDPGPFTDWSAAARAALTLPQVQALNVGKVRLHLLTPQQVSWITADQIRSLDLFDFKYLSPSQIPWLTPAQIATIPDPGPLTEWSAASRAALTAQQVQALRASDVRLHLLTPQQVRLLTSAQIQSLGVPDFKYLSPAQIRTLTPAQVGAIPDPGPLTEWSAEARAALTTTQVQALNVARVHLHLLTPQQTGWLTEAQIQSLELADFKYLRPEQVAKLTTEQVGSIPDPGPLTDWTAESRAALTPAQIQFLQVSKVGLHLLTSQQIYWLTEVQIQSLRVPDFERLWPFQIPTLAPAQVAAIPDPGPLTNWSEEARAALTPLQIRAINVDRVRIHLLTPGQVSWLTTDQIQSLRLHDFQYLNPAQIPLLTPFQIATIPDPGPITAWTPAARAALTAAQVQALNVRNVRINLLTPQQINWLTAEQIRALQMHDFQYLYPAQVPLLMPAQIASIPDPGPLTEWTPGARAALTAAQVQALDVASVHINLLEPRQIAWLTPNQVRSLQLHDYQYLSPAQAPLLTTAQIAAIPDPGPLSAWSEASRAALTMAQVQAIKVAKVGINQLTSDQITWLTPSQIRSLSYADFYLLRPEQIPLITTAQLAALPDNYSIRGWGDAQMAALTRAQLLALPLPVWGALGSLPSTLFPPQQYHPVEHLSVDADGLLTSAHIAEEAKNAFALVPDSAVTHAAIASGDWSDPNIWANGQRPGPNAHVLISSGAVVRFDEVWNQGVSTIRVDGTLEFATDRNTTMIVDTIVVTTRGALHIGTPEAPIADHVTARVVVPDSGPIDAVWDPYLQSRGLISRGEIRMYGKTVTPYAALAVAPSAGDTMLSLAQIPKNWQVGDRIILTGANQHVAGFQSEELTIRAISGTQVRVDALKFNHLPPLGHNLSVHAANLTRNVIFSAQDASVIAERPHIQFMHNTDIQIENISIVGFGRTDKSREINSPVVVNGVMRPGTGTNPRARYAMHFHHLGVSTDYPPAIVRGSLINGSPGWGYVNHSSYVVMENNVAVGVYGSSFATEDGNEIGTMRGNLSINASGSDDLMFERQNNHDFGHGGHGFWFQGPGVEATDNISAGSTDAGFVFFTASSKNLFDAVNLEYPAMAAGHDAVPVGAAPLRGFANNVAYAGKSGLEIWHHQTLMTDGVSYIDDFTSWATRTIGIDMHYVGRTAIRNARLFGDPTTYYGAGIMTNRLTSDIAIVNPWIEGFETGIDVAVRRNATVTGGYISAVRGLFIEKGYDTIRTVNVTGSLTFDVLSPAELRGRTQFTVFASSAFDFTYFPDRRYDSLYSTDFIRIAINGTPSGQLYFTEQSPSFVPFPSATAAGYVAAAYLDKTNQQLHDEFGVTFGGELAPLNLTVAPGVNGMLRYRF